MSLSEKRSCIEVNHRELSIQRQCDLIELPRSSYYRQRNPKIESDVNLALMRLIDGEYTKHPFYGTRKMRNYIRRQGFKVNRKRVQRLMRKMGLQSIAPKPNTSKPAPQHRVYPYLLRNMEITCPNQVWCTDITYSAPIFCRRHGRQRQNLSMLGMYSDRTRRIVKSTSLLLWEVRAEAAVACCILAG